MQASGLKKARRVAQIAQLDTSDLQSQDSSTFEVQSIRCLAESSQPTSLETPKSSIFKVSMASEPILTPQASTRTLLIPTAAEVTESVQAPKQKEFACESTQQANVVEVELN